MRTIGPANRRQCLDSGQRLRRGRRLTAPAVAARGRRSASFDFSSRCRHLGSRFFTGTRRQWGVMFHAGSPMRDWLLPMAPVAALLYFAIYPEQLYALFNWATRYVH